MPPAPPPGSTPWRQAEYSVVDLELTGLDSATSEIVSFAAIPVVEGRVRPGDLHYRVVRPRHMPAGETIRIHGLREADLIEAPRLEEVFDQLRDAIAGRVLVAHVAYVEEDFLRAAFRSQGESLHNPIVDTAALAAELRRLRGLPPQRGAVALADLARSLNLPVHRPHHADGDALTTAQAFIALATLLDAEKRQTVDSLERLRRRPPRRRPPAAILRRLRSALPGARR
jgi:DNA polymerase III subunit epsilon